MVPICFVHGFDFKLQSNFMDFTSDLLRPQTYILSLNLSKTGDHFPHSRLGTNLFQTCQNSVPFLVLPSVKNFSPAVVFIVLIFNITRVVVLC